MEQNAEMQELKSQVARIIQRMSEIQASDQFEDESLGMVTAWTVLTEYESRNLMEQDAVMTFRFSPEGQTRSTTAGLIHLASQR